MGLRKDKQIDQLLAGGVSVITNTQGKILFYRPGQEPQEVPGLTAECNITSNDEARSLFEEYAKFYKQQEGPIVWIQEERHGIPKPVNASRGFRKALFKDFMEKDPRKWSGEGLRMAYMVLSYPQRLALHRRLLPHVRGIMFEGDYGSFLDDPYKVDLISAHLHLKDLWRKSWTLPGE